MGYGSRCRLTALPGRLVSLTVTVEPGCTGNLNHFSWKTSVMNCPVCEPPSTACAWTQFRLGVADGRQYENSEVPFPPVAVALTPWGSVTPAAISLSKIARPLATVVTEKEPRMILPPPKKVGLQVSFANTSMV